MDVAKCLVAHIRCAHIHQPLTEHRDLTAGAQFTCFTGTKVQILTLHVYPQSEILYHIQVDYKRGRYVAGNTGMQFTCFTSTKVQILTQKALDEAPQMRLEYNNADIHGYSAPGDLPSTKGLEQQHVYTALAIPTREYLTILPAPTCAAASETHGAGLTQATGSKLSSCRY